MPLQLQFLIAGLPTYDDDDCVDYNYKEDLETGKIDNRVACRKRTRGSVEAALICP